MQGPAGLTRRAPSALQRQLGKGNHNPDQQFGPAIWNASLDFEALSTMHGAQGYATAPTRRPFTLDSSQPTTPNPHPGPELSQEEVLEFEDMVTSSPLSIGSPVNESPDRIRQAEDSRHHHRDASPPPFIVIDSDSEDDKPVTRKSTPALAPNSIHFEEGNDVFYYDTRRSPRLDGISNPNLQSHVERPNASIPQIAAPPSAEPTLCKEQRDIVNLILEGRNVFYTGSAGCGKSTVLKSVVKALKERNRKVEIVAPTGFAALQIGGKSTWAYMGWTPDHMKKGINELRQGIWNKRVQKRLRDTEVLIIDEISMVENHHFERMNRCFKALTNWFAANGQDENWTEDDIRPFGGKQIVVTGDFCQLAPVKPFEHCIECGSATRQFDYGSVYECPKGHGPWPASDKWAFNSAAWEDCEFVHVHLEEIHRQNDVAFIRTLQKCRLGIPLTAQETDVLMDHPCNVANATRLFSTRAEVQEVNRRNFIKLKTPQVTYKTLDGFEHREHSPQLAYFGRGLPDGSLEQLKDHRLERQVDLKIGMLVVLQVNLNLDIGLCNGSQGIICGFEPLNPDLLPKARTKSSEGHPNSINGDHAKLKQRQIKLFADQQQRKVWPRVHFHNGIKRTIYAECMVNTVGTKEPLCLLHRTQIPLMAAWALSVHKSQGMTLDRVIVDLSKAFVEGQVYVALSRATCLEGLKIEGDRKGLEVGLGGNPEVQQFLMEKFGDRLVPKCT